MIPRFSLFQLLVVQGRPRVQSSNLNQQFNLSLFTYRNISNHVYNRRIPVQSALQKELIHKSPESVPSSKLLQVSVIGDPNAGKSTLVNQLVGWKTCAVSSKVHTTRKMSRSILMDDDNSTQVVFLDTPGLVGVSEKNQHKLEASLLIDPEKSLIKADLLMVLQDVGNKWTRHRLSKKVLRLLHLYPEKESILVLNKVDVLKDKKLLLELIKNLTESVVDGKSLETAPVPSKFFRHSRGNKTKLMTQPENEFKEDNVQLLNENLTEKQVEQIIQDKSGWPNFSRVFIISALNNDGLADVKEYLFDKAQPARWLFHPSVVTDQDPHEMAIATVREKLLNILANEIPYNIDVSIDFWEVDPSGVLKIVMRLDCPKVNISRIIVGAQGKRIGAIAKETAQDFRNIFRCDVRLFLNVYPAGVSQ